MQNRQEAMCEGKKGLQRIQDAEWLAEKKINVYARLLMDPALAKGMEKLAMRHEERRKALLEELGIHTDGQEEEL